MLKSNSSLLPSLPIGWSIELDIPKENSEKFQENNLIDVIVKTTNETAKGKKAIEKLVNNKCKTIEEKRIIFTHVKWYLKRAEGLQGMKTSISSSPSPSSTSLSTQNTSSSIPPPPPSPSPSTTTTTIEKKGRKRTRTTNEESIENQTTKPPIIPPKSKVKLQQESKINQIQKKQDDDDDDDEVIQRTSEGKDKYIDIWNFDDISSNNSNLRRNEYLKWLRLLQFNQNILCFGIGSKYEVLHEFATTMLENEDVIELSSQSSNSLSSSSSSSATTTAITTTTISSQRKKSGEEILWDLFQFIRQNILKVSNGTGGNRIPPSSIWSFHSDGITFPLEFEAQLLSDYLCRHYSWHKSGMGHNSLELEKSIRDMFRFGNQFHEEGDLNENFDYDNEIDNDLNDIDDFDDKSEQSRSVTDRSESPNSSILISSYSRSISLSRESTQLLKSQNTQGTLNYDYVNSISHLYIIFHNIEELFPAISPNINTNSSCNKALSILASCPVISIIASMTSLQTPLYSGWDSLTENMYQWVYIHTPTKKPHEPLPEVLSSVTHASNKIQRDRAVTLKYVLNSLTRKHLDIIKYLLTFSNNESDSIKLKKNSIENISTSSSIVSTPPPITTTTNSSSSQGVRWMNLLNYCVSRLIVKSDTELRELISELKDQRIIKTYSDSDGVVFVTLSLSQIEKESTKEYFQKEKKK